MIQNTEQNEQDILEKFNLFKIDDEIKPGDLYIARRNTVQLLTCKYIDKEQGFIVPTTLDYPYNIEECYKVEEKIT